MASSNLHKIKTDIIGWIESTDKENLIDFINSIRLADLQNIDWMSEISKQEKLSIYRGLQDVENNLVMESSTFWEKLKDESSLD